ncbi:MAG: Rpn family recombination-promoting nuclease/putative transposase, partial [Candidatus Fibromonas sp.]|nr:Rpn family recombination-promoting nuclease/putative transposase [Candidatus Fibromonas sp.]
KLVVLIEHQSSINGNMPIRMLIYMSEVYKILLKGKNIFRKKAISIPRPEFIVLYNGNDKYPDKQVLKLSDMFMDAGDSGSVELELTVRVFNINKGHNKEIASRSEALDGYGYFVYLVKEYAKKMSRDAAIGRAIEDCIRRGILKDFLEEHSSEVRNMLLRDLTWKEHLAVSYEDGVDDGVVIGETRGMEKGMEKVFSLLEKGMSLAAVKRKLGYKTAK